MASDDIPTCKHGPGLLFERFYPDRLPRKFFACSACRDRADCPLFAWADEVDSSSPSKGHSAPSIAAASASGGALLRKVICLKKASSRKFCRTCQQLVDPAGRRQEHEGHDILVGLSKPQLLAPTTWLLEPASASKKRAQILFDKPTVDFLLGLLSSLNFRRILCIGVPRVHEAIQKAHWQHGNKKGSSAHDGPTSYLLDLDGRFDQFYGRDQFCRFNMFNGHVFDHDAGKAMAAFARTADCILMDPPYGGPPPALAATLRQLWGMRDADASPCPDVLAQGGMGDGALPTLFFFPYFSEANVLAALPSFSMMDWCVGYDNHAVYKVSSLSPSSLPASLVVVLLRVCRPPSCGSRSDPVTYCRTTGRSGARRRDASPTLHQASSSCRVRPTGMPVARGGQRTDLTAVLRPFFTVS